MHEGKLELWAGPECSVVRIGDRFVDQTELTGHGDRPGDLDRLAALGVRAVRYPVLWERVCPGAGAPDWRFSDERLGRLRDLGIRPIVGLVHHGSGPRHTSLLEDSFVRGLADFATLVAERYPWITDYTPVNEPLTTARFSGLYGLWYPHRRDHASFVRALVVQCSAVRAAMAAIRAIQPAARLVQTEDLGTMFSTKKLAYQADIETRSRYLSLDLLTGRIDASHSLRAFLEAGGGASPSLLDSFVREPCIPDVIGLNHYVTSDRFIDENVATYPAHVHGGNGVDTYADVEAVRILPEGISGFRRPLENLWSRYGLPLAITEAHLGSTSEEQIRWLAEAWSHAQSAVDAGVDVRAVTAWAAFGATDWDSLLTSSRGHYEPGLFDVRGGVVRPTALAVVATELAARGKADHPLVDAPGWWRRDERILYPSPHATSSSPAGASVLVLGACTSVGRGLVRVARARGLATVAVPRNGLDLRDPRAIAAALDAHRPWAVVSAAGYTTMGEEDAHEALERSIVDVAALVAEACDARGIRYATYSSDAVFDGRKDGVYTEQDVPHPLDVRGMRCAFAEQLILRAHPRALLVRAGAVFDASRASFLPRALAELGAGRPVHAACDAIVSPTYIPDLVDATLTLLIDGAVGLWHVATPGALSGFQLTQSAAELAGISTARLVPSTWKREDGPGGRYPRRFVLGSVRGALMRPIEEALFAFLSACHFDRQPPRGIGEHDRGYTPAPIGDPSPSARGCP